VATAPSYRATAERGGDERRHELVPQRRCRERRGGAPLRGHATAPPLGEEGRERTLLGDGEKDGEVAPSPHCHAAHDRERVKGGRAESPGARHL
jgi:hypothetical protein